MNGNIFQVENEGVVATLNCLRCSTKLGVNLITSTLKNHLNTHGHFLDNDTQKWFGRNDTLTMKLAENAKRPQMSQKEDLVYRIICTLQPLATVKHEKSKNIFKNFHPLLIVPSRYTVHRQVLDQFNCSCLKLKKLLSLLRGRFSLAADLWSPAKSKSYIVITILLVTGLIWNGYCTAQHSNFKLFSLPQIKKSNLCYSQRCDTELGGDFVSASSHQGKCINYDFDNEKTTIEIELTGTWRLLNRWFFTCLLYYMSCEFWSTQLRKRGSQRCLQNRVATRYN